MYVYVSTYKDGKPFWYFDNDLGHGWTQDIVYRRRIDWDRGFYSSYCPSKFMKKYAVECGLDSYLVEDAETGQIVEEVHIKV